MTGRAAGGSGKVGVFGAIRERLVLFVVLAASLFACTLITAQYLQPPPGAEVRLGVEIVDLASDTDSPASLISPVAFDPAALRDRLSARSTAVEIEAAKPLPRDPEGYRRFVIRSTADDVPTRADDLKALTRAFIDAENRRRSLQRDEAAAWIERRTGLLQNKIDAAKAAILRSPLDPDPLDAEQRSDDEHLLGLFIDTMTEAQGTGDVGSGAAEGLGGDVARLQQALDGLQDDQITLIRHGNALKNAESDLATLREEAGRLMGEGGILDRPAVEIIDIPAPPVTPAFQLDAHKWGLLAALGVLCLIIAAIAVVIISRLRPRRVAAADDYLNDPNWPLPAGAHREL